MNYLSVSFFFILISLNFFAQENNGNLKEVVEQISAKKMIIWARSETCNSFIKDTLSEKLNSLASDQELIELTRHKNGNVRYYAFNLLAEKSNPICYSIILENVKNETKFKNGWSCVSKNDYVADFWIYLVSGNGWCSNYKLSENQLKELDSILINDKSILLQSRYYSIDNLEVVPKNYNLIKSIVIKENGKALVKLAEFQKSGDRKVIDAFLKSKKVIGLMAVEKFPDHYFYKNVKKWVSSERKKTHYWNSDWDRIFLALSKYPTPETLHIFEEALNEKDKFKKDIVSKNLLMAILKNPNPIYDGLKNKIVLSDTDREEAEMMAEYYKSR